MSRRARGSALLLLLPLAGCSMPAALDPAGPEAGAVGGLIWWFTGICAAVWVAVVVGLAIAMMRGRQRREDPLAPTPKHDRRAGAVVATLVGLTGATVIGLALLSYVAQQRLFAATGDELAIKVIGHQWWWELRYPNADPSKYFTTANELHVPVGQPVALELSSVDVIHSFWVPSLMGKADLVPGRSNSLRFTVDKPGSYRGQCAEFCGLQHSFMGLRVIAHEPAEFEAWREAQAAAATITPVQQPGRDTFLSKPCVSCHAVRGTPAGGTFGPDLTHLASRTSIASDTLPLTRGALAAWITDPQSIKPGTNMPTIKLEPAELERLLDFLMGLT